MFKRRKKHEKKHREGEIPTGSFSDIAFLLIIYFLIATTLIKVKSFQPDIPTGETSTQQQQDETPTIYLRGDQMLFGENPVDLNELSARLDALDLEEKEPEQRIIMLETTSDTPYQRFFEVMAVIRDNSGVAALVKEDQE